MELSIVSTMYRSAPFIEEFCARISREARKITGDYEIILVNDGSPDDSLEVALSIQRKDPRVAVVDLSRNFGHHKAMMTGLAHARGERVFLIDCDLEEEPELLGLFHERFREAKTCDVVYGVQKERKGGALERLSGALFYRLMNFFSDTSMPHNIVTARLMSARYVKSLLEYGESEVFLAGLFHITGYEQVPLPMTKLSKGSSSYTLSKKLALFINALTSFSSKPLVYIFYTGALIFLVSAAYISYLLFRKLAWGIAVGGWASLIVSVWFLGGLTIFFLGIIGIYLSKVFMESKHRPYTTVRHVYRKDRE